MGFFGLELALGVPKSARIEKIKKYGFFKVNSEQGYFFDFSGSGPGGLPGRGVLWQKSYHPAGCRSAVQPFFGLILALGGPKIARIENKKNSTFPNSP